MVSTIQYSKVLNLLIILLIIFPILFHFHLFFLVPLLPFILITILTVAASLVVFSIIWPPAQLGLDLVHDVTGPEAPL